MDNTLSFGEILTQYFSEFKRDYLAASRMNSDCSLRHSEIRALNMIARLIQTRKESETAGIRIGELCEVSHVSKSNISQILRTLEAHQYIIRQPDPTDRRSVRILLTNEGKSLIKKMDIPWIDLLDKTGEILGPEKSAEFISQLKEFGSAFTQCVENERKDVE